MPRHLITITVDRDASTRALALAGCAVDTRYVDRIPLSTHVLLASRYWPMPVGGDDRYERPRA
jgi:hypothetical protein